MAVGGWQLVVCGGWRLAVSGWWWLGVGSWWLVTVGGSGPWGLSFMAFLNGCLEQTKNTSGFLTTAVHSTHPMATVLRCPTHPRRPPRCSPPRYCKAECLFGRKMAHITVVADSFRTLGPRVEQLGIPPEKHGLGDGGARVGIVMGSDSDLPVMQVLRPLPRHWPWAARKLLCGGGMAWAPGEGGGVPEMGFRAGPFVLCKDGCCHQRRRNTNFGLENFFHEKIFPHICAVKMISATWGSF